MNVLGKHVLLELKECNPKLLNNLDYIRNSLLQAAEDIGAHVVGESFHQFSPQGVPVSSPLPSLIYPYTHGLSSAMLRQISLPVGRRSTRWKPQIF